MRLKTIVLIVLFFAIRQCLFAQGNIYQFSHLDITNGLSNNRVNCIYKDANGFMWFGTTCGLNRYDGYKFRVFNHITNDNASLLGDNVLNITEGPDRSMWVYTHSGICIYDSDKESFTNDISRVLFKYKVTGRLNLIKKDNDGNFWFLTDNQGLYCYHPSTKTTDFYGTSAKSKIILHSNAVSDVVGGSKNLWIIYSDGVIEKMDPATGRILLVNYRLAKANNDKPQNYAGLLANDHNLWIYATGTFLGLYFYDTQASTLTHIAKNTAGIRLNSNVINNIVQGNDDNVWVGTDHGGIDLINLKTHKVTYLLNEQDNPQSLGGNSDVLYKDDEGILWAGTFKEGISYYHKGIIQFPLVRHYVSNSESLPYEDVDCSVEDANGNLWIGTNGGGLIFYNKVTRKYTQYKHDSSNPHSLSNDIVISLCIDHDNRLWIGTYFGGMDRLEGNKFIHYRHKDGDPTSISDDRVYSIIEDSSQRLWAGTFTGGLNIYNPKTNGFIHPDYPMSSEYTAVLYQDRQKNIWIGRDKGIDIIEKKGTLIKHYHNKPQNHNSLVANDVNCIIQDRNGLYWIGTKDGLSILNDRTGKFININEDNGLPNNDVLNILEDNSGLIWMSTSNGLASIKLTKKGGSYNYEIHKYNEFDGLQGREYNANSALKTRNGDLLFGGPHGFNLFNPDNIHTFNLNPKLLFTDFQLFNKSVKVGDTISGRVVLSRPITETKSLVLNHSQNVFSIEFAVCDYFNPGKIVYQYKLDGFDQGWLTSPKNVRKATYTNLDAGDYTFRVRAFNTNNPHNVNEAILHIEILPPFWKTTLAYIIYSLIVIGMLLYIRHRGILKIKREFELRQEKLEAERKVAKEREHAQRMHELDLMKIKFFTNVSHEFRTPLSLIIAPIDNLIKNIQRSEQQQQLLMIKRNGKRLLNLVNQLLDFRKMESKELKLNQGRADIIRFIKEVCSSFTDLASQNLIGYVFDSEIESLVTRFDSDKIERVLFNLLSNSFKFTSPGGHVSVFINLVKSRHEEQEKQFLEIKILDTGIGIPKEKQGKIFERFFQDDLPEGQLNQGSGIGLSISREFIKMHDGEIYVESEPGQGSCFIIKLPVGAECDQAAAALPQNNPAADGVAKNDKHDIDTAKKPLVLLIEDDSDMRFYLKDNLKYSFHIVEAVNGKEGWQKALAMHPDLIVSDVSIPEMNGLELCKKIRQDNRTAHIPLILLTALTEEQDQIAGAICGANDYIIKPFNFEILLSKINGLLLMQQTLKKTYQKQVDIYAPEIDIISEDEKFLANTMSCIEKNIANPGFSVEELSRQMSMSRVSLYKRLLTLTGKTPVDCIRTIRLQRAVQLLEKSRLSISGIAYEVGFNSATYFSKVFKDEYGMLPSAYANDARKREKDHKPSVSEI